jgi:hypothetical protein
MKPPQKKSTTESGAFSNVILSAKVCKKLSLKKTISLLEEIAQSIFESHAVSVGQSKVLELSDKEVAQDFMALQQAKALLVHFDRVFSGKTLDNIVTGSRMVNQELN